MAVLVVEGDGEGGWLKKRKEFLDDDDVVFNCKLVAVTTPLALKFLCGRCLLAFLW